MREECTGRWLVRTVGRHRILALEHAELVSLGGRLGAGHGHGHGAGGERARHDASRLGLRLTGGERSGPVGVGHACNLHT